MNKKESSYIIITPVFNEEAHLNKTINSIVNQTILPLRWVIVDDGSTDKTGDIIQEYSGLYNWISVLCSRKDSIYNLKGGSEIKAFYYGYETIKFEQFQFIGKIDGDISFEPTFFENILKEFHRHPQLGIAGGTIYTWNQNKALKKEIVPSFHVRGATKIYRKECWDDIGGVEKKLGWDAVDIYKARMLGWDTKTYDNLKVIHYVKTGSKKGVLKGRIRAGKVYYLMGSHPLFIIIKEIFLMFRKPYILGTIASFLGYIESYIQQDDRVVNNKLRAFIRNQQLRRLIFKKPFINN